MQQRMIFPVDDVEATHIAPGKPVVLIGAGIFANMAVHSLRQRGIVPVCIGDNAAAKQGTFISGIPVVAPTAAQMACPDSTAIITAAPKYLPEIKSQLVTMGWKRIYDCAPLLASFTYDTHTFQCGVSSLHYDLDRYFYEYYLARDPDKLIAPSLDVIITERCSLKCRDCSNLMQYYSHPEDLSIEVLFRALDLIMQAVDHVMEFRVLGGETFMNRRAHEYIDRLRQYRNYTRIAVYSNGTIVPRGQNLSCLAHQDTYLRISDYGPLSSKLNELKKVFDSHQIVYGVQTCAGWQECAHIRKRERAPAETDAVFARCCANKLLTLLRGKLHVCPFAANAVNLGAIPASSDGPIPVDEVNSVQELRGRMVRMLRSRSSFSACGYCSGRFDHDLPLPVAVQTKRALSYLQGRDGGLSVGTT